MDGFVYQSYAGGVHSAEFCLNSGSGNSGSGESGQQKLVFVSASQIPSTAKTGNEVCQQMGYASCFSSYVKATTKFYESTDGQCEGKFTTNTYIYSKGCGSPSAASLVCSGSPVAITGKNYDVISAERLDHVICEN